MRITLLALTAALAAGCYNPDLGVVGFYCKTTDSPACPDGTTCRPYSNPTTMKVENRCQKPLGVNQIDASGGLIPKTGSYSGVHSDPGLMDLMSCPDATLEPNDSPDKALDAPAAAPDMLTPKVTKMAICPKGPRPDTGQHDVDYFRVTTTQSGLTLMAQVYYDITFGDLDVGIFDSNGMLLGYDGSAVTDACATAAVGAGTYYVVVAGANNTDVNRYQLRIRTYSTPQQCAVVAPLDMSL